MGDVTSPAPAEAWALLLPFGMLSRDDVAGFESSIEEMDMLLEGRCRLGGTGRSRPFKKEVLAGVRAGSVWG